MMEFIVKNREWLFSGIGVVILGWLWKSFTKKDISEKKTNQVININISEKLKENNEMNEDTEVSGIVSRFKEYKRLLNENRCDQYTIASLAEILKLNSVSELENIFLGKIEPGFKFIDHFCNTFGVNREWLIEGKNKPFYCSKQTNYDPYQYLDYILEKKPENVYFIRSSSERGEVFILLKFNDWKFEVLHRVWHISSHVGSGGQRQIYGMYKLIMALKKKMYTNCYGRILSQDEFYLIFEGAVFPSSIIDYRGMQENPWWDDFTDVNHYYSTSKYYQDWHGDEFLSAQRVVKYYLENENK